MNIFSDRHHSGLANSLHLTLEKRLGHNLYFPIGMEWAQEKWWLIHKPYDYSMDTAKQYLQIKPDYIPMDGTVILNHVIAKKATHYEVQDFHEGYVQKCITLEQFKEMNIDIIIASIPDHWVSFTRLRDAYKPNAKVICQMGNHFVEADNMIADGTIKNLMASTAPFPVSCHSVFYRQEFDLHTFYPSPMKAEKQITAFINCYQQNGGYAEYIALKSMMPDFEFRSYGGQCDNGPIGGLNTLAYQMQRSYFGFHVKAGADGYGHTIHNFFACGIPVIINYDEYKNKLAGSLLIPDETCIVANRGDNMQPVAEKIMNLSPHQYVWMRQRVFERFQNVCDFDKEEQKIRTFLENLV